MDYFYYLIHNNINPRAEKDNANDTLFDKLLLQKSYLILIICCKLQTSFTCPGFSVLEKNILLAFFPIYGMAAILVMCTNGQLYIS